MSLDKEEIENTKAYLVEVAEDIAEYELGEHGDADGPLRDQAHLLKAVEGLDELAALQGREESGSLNGA